MTVTEQDIKDAGADKAPRITPEDIEAVISSQHFIHMVEATREAIATLDPDQTALYCLTICVLVLKNGFTVVGKSACASPANYIGAIGERIAREDAVRQIWALEGYRLRSQLSNA